MWRTTLMLAVTLIGAAAAYGDEPTAACAGDVERFCREVRPGGGRVVVCLRQHTRELAPACKDALVTMANSETGSPSRGRRWYRTCKADITTFCKNVPAGGGRIAECLESHAEKLSRGCKSAVDARRARATARQTTPRSTAGAASTPRPTAAAASTPRATP